MRIFDTLRDYYDSMQAYGADPKLVYERGKRKELLLPHQGAWNTPQEFDIPRMGRIGNDLQAKALLIGIAGKFIPVIQITDTTDWKNKNFLTFYSAKEYLNWKANVKKNVSSSYWLADEKKELERFFNTILENDKYFLQLEAPLLLISYSTAHTKSGILIRTNPILMDYQFGKIQDQFTLYQEIATYLGNQLVKEKEVLVIKDKYKITQHGFDEHSFRHPTK